jgi:type II secretion system protein L
MNSHFENIAENSQVLVLANEPCIWVPSNLLVVHQVPVPSAPKRKWSELVPWILEDKLLQAPEDMHFVIAGKNADKLIVLVTAKNQIQEWKKSVDASGLESYQLIPDYLALPWHSGLLSIGKYSEHILVRYGEFEGFSATPELAWHMLAALFQKTEFLLTISICMPEVELPEQFRDKIEIKHQAIDWQNDSFPGSANLLTGNFTLATNSNDFMPWLKTAALFVLALILSFAILNGENNRLEQEIANLEEQNRTDFYRLFPGLTIRSSNIRATLESHISNRFRQRESLQSEGMQTLTTIDRAMSACNCDLQSLTLSNNVVELILPRSMENIVEQWSFEEYEEQISANSDGSLTLTLNKELAR